MVRLVSYTSNSYVDIVFFQGMCSIPFVPAAGGRWLVLVGLLVSASCALAGGEVNPMTMKLFSPAFGSSEPIPRRYTCDGEDVSPPLRWSGVPGGTRSLALIVDDPDAPDPAAPKMVWSHWVVYNLPPGMDGLPEGIASLPAGALDGINDWNRVGYGGPCPPVGRHRYFFRLYALDAVLPNLERPSRPELLQAMQGHVIAEAELVGTYQRHSAGGPVQ